MKKYIKGVSKLDLFAHYCTCGEFQVDGFWHQLEKSRDPNGRTVTLKTPCRTCGTVRLKKYRTTTGWPLRRRLCPWSRWVWTVLSWVPHSWLRPTIWLFLKLERWCPL